MIFLTVLVVLLALPLVFYAQEADPEAVITAVLEAINAGDVDAALTYYADDTVVNIVPFGAHTARKRSAPTLRVP